MTPRLGPPGAAVALALALAIVLTGCGKPARSASYFEARPVETSRVLAACREGRTRGDECHNADLGRLTAERQARMRAWRGLFEK